jgi:glycosidase
MPSWPSQPVVYEINTWPWIREIGRAAGQPVTLGTVPSEAWDDLARLGFDAVWLMGVWERSPAGLQIALASAENRVDFHRALPDFSDADAVGSPYCVRGYVADEALGGRAGLAAARLELAQRGIRLILDYVPNHVAPDHPWALKHPEHFVRGDPDDLRREPEAFLDVAGRAIARGRDPFFPPWRDVLQLNAFHPALRKAATETLAGIAAQCDGVRCDMAMLVLNDVFARTWGARAGPPPAVEFWPPIIAAVKERHPHFRFIAEAYWGLEGALLEQGFDHCYDKVLYDRLVGGGAVAVRQHLHADAAHQARLLRFIENHDEPRAAAAFSPGGRLRAAAVAFATLPGARLLHEGQLQGRRVQLPVFLIRRPEEPSDSGLEAFHRTLLRTIAAPVFREGTWRLLQPAGWADNRSSENLLAWSWELAAERQLVVVNFSDAAAQARLRLPWADHAGRRLRLVDAFTQAAYDRDGGETLDPGLFVDLPAWGFHLLSVVRTSG